jgi:hypothetical protein
MTELSDTPETDNLARGNHVVPTEWAEQLERERDEARAQIGKLCDIAERAIEMKEQEVWGRSALSFSWKQLRAELDQIKEGVE